ncbi:MAG: hypothetical protein HY921_10345 [Elusimicrobia bacterium]|nr:hypothetical protein [Elusimicrobiota bacterium]
MDFQSDIPYKIAGKVFLGLVTSVLGMHYLALGKRNQEVEKMIWGAALIIASFLIF